MAKKSKKLPLPVSRGMREIGKQLAIWRRLRGLTMVQVAERANISVHTLRHIESSTGSPQLENVLRVARAVGVLDLLVQSMDPYATDVGRLRFEEILPQRVRPAKNELVDG